MSKKSFKEKQQERQIKQKRFEEAQKKRKEAESKTKRNLPKKKIILVVSIIIIIIGVVLVWQFAFKNFTAIYIRADGKIDPDNVAISSSDFKTYTLTDDIFGSIIIERDNIEIDGKNHLLYGKPDTNYTGIEIAGRNNVSVTNLRIKDFKYGVFVNSSSNILITKNNLKNEYGVGFNSCSNNVIVENDLSDCFGAVLFAQSSNNQILQNTFNNNNYSLNLDYGSSNNLISENVIGNGQEAIFVSK